MIRLRPTPFELKKRYDSLPTALREKREAVNFEIAVRTVAPVFRGVLIASLFESKWAILLPSGIAVWAGLQLRADLDKEVLCPRPWYTNMWTLRRPMLIFDIWTIGAFAVFFTLGLLREG